MQNRLTYEVIPIAEIIRQVNGESWAFVVQENVNAAAFGRCAWTYYRLVAKCEHDNLQARRFTV